MSSITSKRLFYFAGLTTVAVISIYTISITVFHYFDFTKESYTEYFWPRRNWLIIHILAGLTAILAGPFQFIKRIRAYNIKFHRLLGKIYLTSILIGAPVGFYLALTSNINFVYATGLSMLAVTWFSTSAMAYIAIRRGNIAQHREWMIRSYVVTFAFIFFRLGMKLLESLDNGPFEMGFALLSWACWSIPLFVSEICIQSNKIIRVKQSAITKRKSESPMVTIPTE